jgi:abortive infection bacteriophage resistance protein
MSHTGGPHFYYDETYFECSDIVTSLRKLGENGKHLSIKHYRKTYGKPFLPPIWALAEETSFGQLSRLYSNLERPYRKSIASQFGLDESICTSWFRSLATLRNICAHHGRLWNAELFVDRPKKAKAYKADLYNNVSLYSRVVIIRVLMSNIDSYGMHAWLPKLKQLINNRPTKIHLNQMGFPEDWETRSIWM